MSKSTDVLVYGLQSPPVHPEVVKEVKMFYENYYASWKESNEKTGDASGIVRLAQLLEGKDGLLTAIILKKRFEPLYEKEDTYENSPFGIGALYHTIKNGKYSHILSEEVKRFKDLRNKPVHAVRSLSRTLCFCPVI